MEEGFFISAERGVREGVEGGVRRERATGRGREEGVRRGGLKDGGQVGRSSEAEEDEG